MQISYLMELKHREAFNFIEKEWSKRQPRISNNIRSILLYKTIIRCICIICVDMINNTFSILNTLRMYYG